MQDRLVERQLGRVHGHCHHKITLAVDGYNVSFETDDLKQLRVVSSIFSPFWDVRQPEDSSLTADWSIVSCRIPGFEETLQGVTHWESIRLYGNVFGRRVVLNPALRIVAHGDLRDGLSVHRPEEKLSYFIFYGQAGYLTQLEHLIKYTVRQWLRRQRFEDLHASMCVYEGKQILIVGNSGSGKTTLLMHLLSEGCDYIGNDSVFIRRDSQLALEVRAWPHIIRVGEGTIEKNEILNGYFATSAVPLSVSNEAGPRQGGDGKIEFYIPILQSIFSDLVVIREATVDCVIYPEFDAERKKTTITPTTPDLFIDKAFTLDHGTSWLEESSESLIDINRKSRLAYIRDSMPQPWLLQFGGPATHPVEVLLEAVADI